MNTEEGITGGFVVPPEFRPAAQAMVDNFDPKVARRFQRDTMIMGYIMLAVVQHLALGYVPDDTIQRLEKEL